MPKKKWHEPELIVLARSKPEEAVLIGCKNTSVTNAYQDGYGNVNKQCIYISHGACPPTWCESGTVS